MSKTLTREEVTLMFSDLKDVKMKPNKSQKQFQKEVYDLVGGEYTVIGEYVHAKKKLLVRHNCNKCGNNEYLISPHSFLQGWCRCPMCKHKRTEEKFIQIVLELYGDEFTVIGRRTEQIKILMRHNCDLCDNYEWNANQSTFVNNQGKCPKCLAINKAKKKNNRC